MEAMGEISKKRKRKRGRERERERRKQCLSPERDGDGARDAVAQWGEWVGGCWSH